MTVRSVIVAAVLAWSAIGVAAQSRPAQTAAPRGDGSTPLHWAVYRSDLREVRRLIAAKADANAANRLGMTPLLLASRQGDAAAMQALLEAGADPHRVYTDGETALMAAAAAGTTDGVKLLLARKVDVNARERWKSQTALMWAAGEGHAAVVGALIAAGADVNVVARSANLPRERGDAGRMWVDWANGGLTAVMFATRQGHTEVVGLLADAGADLNRANPDGLDALTIAILNDRLDLAGVLLEQGAAPSVDALYEAIHAHNIRTNEMAGESTRPRPDHPNTLTPVDLVARLLDKGADPNAMATHTLHLDGTGQPQPVNETPFLRAVRAQDVAMLRLLLGRGGDPNQALESGQPALQAAIGGGGRGFAGGFGAVPAGFRFEAERSATAAAKLLIEAGADIHATTRAGDTALHAAAQAGNLELIQLLADAGAPLDAVNKAGLTPFDLASGKRAPAPAGRGGGGGGPGGPGGPAQPNPQAMDLLQKLMGTR